MEFKVFDSSLFGSQIDEHSVVMSLARVIHPHAKVRDKLSECIVEICNSVTSCDWTSNI